MLFVDRLKYYRDKVLPEMESLLKRGFDKQAHPGDMLVLYCNGAYQAASNITEAQFLIGPDTYGWSEYTHYEFIVAYRKASTHPLPFEDYQKELTWMPDRQAIIKQLSDYEAISVQMEMLIYLKFWEADSYIKWFAQFLRILHGEEYDWLFKIKGFGGSGGKIRKVVWKTDVIDRLKVFSPLLHSMLLPVFQPQIRNSIAHSNYSIIGRHIQLNNAKDTKNPEEAIQVVSFDEWINIFHITITLHDMHTRINNLINEHYAAMLNDDSDSIPIRMHDAAGNHRYARLVYQRDRKDWTFYRKPEQ